MAPSAALSTVFSLALGPQSRFSDRLLVSDQIQAQISKKITFNNYLKNINLGAARPCWSDGIEGDDAFMKFG
jgi:hypothetical protein